MLTKRRKLLKAVIVGNPKVGKTSILKLINNHFHGDISITIRGLPNISSVNIHDNLYLSLWDIDLYGKILDDILHGWHVAIIVFDITFRNSFKTIPSYWFHYLGVKKALTKSDLKEVIIVANKSDLSEKAQVTDDEIRQLANEYNVECIKLSTKTGTNIDKLIKMLVEKSINLFKAIDEKDKSNK